MKVYVDGEGWNGTWCGIMVVTEDGREMYERCFHHHTSNEMEYLAVLAGITVATREDVLITDSKLVYNHLSSNWIVRASHLKPLCNRAKRKMTKKNLTIKWVSRDKNLAGLKLDEAHRCRKREKKLRKKTRQKDESIFLPEESTLV